MLIATYMQGPEITLDEVADRQPSDGVGQLCFVVMDLDAPHKAIVQHGAKAMAELGRDVHIVVAAPWGYLKKLAEALEKAEKEIEDLKGKLANAKKEIKTLKEASK